MQCPQCQQENRDTAKFCESCGSSLALRCPSCDNEVRVSATFCDQCGTQLGTSTPTPSKTQPITQDSPPTSASFISDAERRQLTVMFSELVGSTALSGQLDPEDLREVVRAYQEAAAEVIQRYERHIAQYLGDGLLVYFGYPVAHEDDAQRAVHTGLGIVEAITARNAQLTTDYDVQLAVRVGIHTGPVVVGEMGGGGRHEQLALGKTPNVAARIQGLAESNTVVISGATAEIVQGYFEWQELGRQTLSGTTEPTGLYQVLQESGIQSRLEMASTLTPLVGRDSEVTLLLERWEQAQAGQGQIVLPSGEAGIGKSRLVQALKDHVAEGTHARLEGRSSPYYQNTALYPMIDLAERGAGFHRDDPAEIKLTKLEQALSEYRLPLEETVPLLAPLLSLPIPENRYPSLNFSPQQQRQKTLETTVALLLELAERHPLLFIVEDLHWTDPTTLELLGLLLDQTPAASMFILLTCRPEFQSPWSPRSYLTRVPLNRLPIPQVEQIIERLTDGAPLPAEILQQIVEKTDGVPLFVEEMTKAVAQYAAVIGRQFAYDLLQAVSQLDGVILQRELQRLVEAELVYQRGLPPHAVYVFKHALIQDTAYTSLLRSTRQHYHQQIAHVMEGQFPDLVTTQPELLAHHYTEAGLNEHAIPYWQQAGERSKERSAHTEAIVHFSKGIELCLMLGDVPERTEQELTLQLALGASLIETKGHTSPEVAHVYARARELSQQVEDSSQLFTVLVRLSRVYAVRGECRIAHELASQGFAVAQRLQDPARLVVAHWQMGTQPNHSHLKWE